MINIENKKDCCGCMACAQICPQNCINMKCDDEGFWYPEIDVDKCISCGLCDKVCPMGEKINNKTSKEVYACWNKDENMRVYSTSGGLFHIFAQSILKKGGYVSGAVYKEDFTVKHKIINAEDELEPLLQSKYMQSGIGNTFKLIRDLAIQGKDILFCGTPCQNTALKLYLGKEYNNVYQCDFICRGVISPKVFLNYIDWLETKYKSKVKKVQFKNKDYGWNQFSTKILFENNEIFQKDRFNDPYMVSFLEHNIDIRPSCHECQFKGTDRVSDITLGDFWGIGAKNPELDSDKGTSVVMINTEKGKRLFENIKNDIVFCLCDVDDIRKGNACLDNCPPVGKNRDKFFAVMEKKGFDAAYHKYCKKPLVHRIKQLIKRLINYK